MDTDMAWPYDPAAGDLQVAVFLFVSLYCLLSHSIVLNNAMR